MMRVGLYRSVHVKSEASMEKRTLLAARKLLQGQNRAIENDVRGLLRSFGLKVGPTSAGTFDARVRQLVEDLPGLTAIQRMDFLDRVDSAPFRTVAIGARVEVRFEDRLEYKLGSGLHRSVPYCRHTPSELHYIPTDLWARLKSFTHSTRGAASGLSF